MLASLSTYNPIYLYLPCTCITTATCCSIKSKVINIKTGSRICSYPIQADHGFEDQGAPKSCFVCSLHPIMASSDPSALYGNLEQLKDLVQRGFITEEEGEHRRLQIVSEQTVSFSDPGSYNNSSLIDLLLSRSM